VEVTLWGLCLLYQGGIGPGNNYPCVPISRRPSFL
jgi:hypothetical protein